MVDGNHHSKRPALALVPPLTSAINALLNFPLDQLDSAWRFPHEWDPIASSSLLPQWRSTSPAVQGDRTSTMTITTTTTPTTVTTTTDSVPDHYGSSAASSSKDEAQRHHSNSIKGEPSQDPPPPDTHHSSVEAGSHHHNGLRRSNPARRLAASLLARAQRHAHPLKQRRAGTQPNSSSNHTTPSSSILNPLESECMPPTSNSEAEPYPTSTTPSDQAMPILNSNGHHQDQATDAPPPVLLTALLTLLEASLMRYFGPSSSTESSLPDTNPTKVLLSDLALEDTSLLTVRANVQACTQDGIKNIEENLCPLFSLLRKMIEEDEYASCVEQDSVSVSVSDGSSALSSLHNHPGTTPVVIPLREHIRIYLLPSTLDRTIHLSLRTDFRGVLIRLLSAPAYPQLMASAGALMLSVFHNDPQLLSNEIGYGPSIGFLMSAGLAGGVTKPTSHTRSSSQQLTTCSNPTHHHPQHGNRSAVYRTGHSPSSSHGGHWDPITGTLRTEVAGSSKEDGVGGTGMTEQEAAKEAEVLMRLMERLNRPSTAATTTTTTTPSQSVDSQAESGTTTTTTSSSQEQPLHSQSLSPQQTYHHADSSSCSASSDRSCTSSHNKAPTMTPHSSPEEETHLGSQQQTSALDSDQIRSCCPPSTNWAVPVATSTSITATTTQQSPCCLTSTPTLSSSSSHHSNAALSFPPECLQQEQQDKVHHALPAEIDPARWAQPRESASTVTTVSSWQSSDSRSGDSILTAPEETWSTMSPPAAAYLLPTHPTTAGTGNFKLPHQPSLFVSYGTVDEQEQFPTRQIQHHFAA